MTSLKSKEDDNRPIFVEDDGDIGYALRMITDRKDDNVFDRYEEFVYR